MPRHDHADDDEEEDITEALDDYPPVASDFADGTIVPVDSLLPPQSFQSLFALVTDSRSSEIYHPSMYYVFADDAENERDGHDAATIAALTALSNDAAGHFDQQAGDLGDTEVEERFVLLDLESSNAHDGIGLRVRQAASLSPSWAVTSATLRQAPTLDDDDAQDSSIMLLLEGAVADTDVPKQSGANVSSDRAQLAMIRQQASRNFDEVRKRAGGNVIEGMGILLKQLDHGFVASNALALPHEEASHDLDAP